ncbi:MAG: hypothetical protein LBB14_01940 [Puniceicoccales bacterium]|jgi:hypothetical protein|nr:hypothetical protein [Puniceicoccales bacterium]
MESTKISDREKQMAGSIGGDVGEFCQNMYIDLTNPLLRKQVLKVTRWEGHSPMQVSNFPANALTDPIFGRERHAAEHPDADFISFTQEWRGLRVDAFRGRVHVTAEVPFGTMKGTEARGKDVQEMVAVFVELLNGQAWPQLDGLLGEGAFAVVSLSCHGVADVGVFPQSSLDGSERAKGGSRRRQSYPVPMGGGTVSDIGDVSEWKEALKVE